jgi:hypothetical protein
LLGPVVLVLENPDHARALAARIFFHLHQNGKELGELRPRLVLVLERKDRAVATADIGPDTSPIFHFDLEHVVLR